MNTPPKTVKHCGCCEHNQASAQFLARALVLTLNTGTVVDVEQAIAELVEHARRQVQQAAPGTDEA